MWIDVTALQAIAGVASTPPAAKWFAPVHCNEALVSPVIVTVTTVPAVVAVTVAALAGDAVIATNEPVNIATPARTLMDRDMVGPPAWPPGPRDVPGAAS